MGVKCGGSSLLISLVILNLLLPTCLGRVFSTNSKDGVHGGNLKDVGEAFKASATDPLKAPAFLNRAKRSPDYDDDDYDAVADTPAPPPPPPPPVKGNRQPSKTGPPEATPPPPPAKPWKAQSGELLSMIQKGQARTLDDDDYDTSYDPSIRNKEKPDTPKIDNPKGEIVSNAHSKHGQSLSIAIAKMGADASANSLNGTGAIAMSETRGRGEAKSTSSTFGEEGAKSDSIAKGHGEAKSYAIARGSVGDSDTHSKAIGGNALADSVSIRGTQSKSMAETSRAGNATSKSIALLGGNSTAASFARGQGNSKATTYVDDKGVAQSIAKTKSTSGKAVADSMGLRDAQTYSIASAKKTGTALAKSHTGIRGKSRSDATAAQGDAVAITIQDSSQKLEVKDFANRGNFKDHVSSEEVVEEEQDSEETETVSEAARKKRSASGSTSNDVARGETKQ